MRIAQHAALFAMAVVSVASVACTEADPLDAIDRQQRSGDLAGSVEPLRALLAEGREDSRLMFLYGRALTAIGTPTEAFWALEAAMEDPEYLVPAGLAMASGAYQTRNFTVALDAVEAILEEHPDHIDALLLRAQTRAQQRLDLEQALADAERVLEAEPDNVGAMEPKILALLGLERIDEAAEAMEVLGEAIRETQLSRDGLAWHCATMAIFANDGGHVDLARERWTECLEEFPSHSEVVGKAIRFHDGLQEWDASIEILRAAMDDAPGQIQYRLELANRLRIKGSIDEAEALLLEATLSEAPSDRVAAWLGLVTHHQTLGDYAAGAEAAGNAVEVARSVGTVPPQIAFDHADALVMAGDFEGAAAVAETIELPAYRELVLGRSLLQRGQPEAALEHFSEAFRLWPDNPFARYYAARAAEEIGDFDRAVEEYRYSIRIDPGATDARQRLGALHAAEGKPALAMHVLQTKVQDVPLDLEGDLLAAELFAWVGQRKMLTPLINRYSKSPSAFARVIARASRGLERRAGPRVAIRAIEGTRELRLDDPVHIEALRALAAVLVRGGAPDAAIARVQAASDRHPQSPALHALHATVLADAGAGDDRIRAACDRALELEPANAEALTRMGDVTLRVDATGALALYERALGHAPDDRDARLGAGQALMQLEMTEEARGRLEALLRDEPYDLEVARALVALERAAPTSPDRLDRLLARIERFTMPQAPLAVARPDAAPAGAADTQVDAGR